MARRRSAGSPGVSHLFANSSHVESGWGFAGRALEGPGPSWVTGQLRALSQICAARVTLRYIGLLRSAKVLIVNSVTRSRVWVDADGSEFGFGLQKVAATAAHKLDRLGVLHAFAIASHASEIATTRFTASTVASPS